jgi:hypothetical protein
VAYAGNAIRAAIRMARTMMVWNPTNKE